MYKKESVAGVIREQHLIDSHVKKNRLHTTNKAYEQPLFKHCLCGEEEN